MGKKLAIKGHPTRGKEVIELLEMMDGKAIAAKGNDETTIYVIPENGIINVRFAYQKHIDNYAIFTLEEFLEKYPFKIGDKVIDKADGCPGIVSEMKWDADVSDMKYCVVFGNGIDFGWFTNDSIEFCKKEKNLDETKVESTGFMQLGKTFAVIFNDANYEDEVELQLGNYEIEVRDGRTYAVKKKPKYPTTYDECCDMLDADEFVEYELMTNFPKLINARNAYWKIAGEQMGLDKSWESPLPSLFETVYCIRRKNNEIIKGSYRGGKSEILEFPTEEMRDVFYDNFKDLIEQCKELL